MIFKEILLLYFIILFYTLLHCVILCYTVYVQHCSRIITIRQVLKKYCIILYYTVLYCIYTAKCKNYHNYQIKVTLAVKKIGLSFDVSNDGYFFFLFFSFHCKNQISCHNFRTKQNFALIFFPEQPSIIQMTTSNAIFSFYEKKIQPYLAG